MRKLWIIAIAMSTLVSLNSCRSEKQKMEDDQHADEMNDDKFEGDTQKDAQFAVDMANMNLEEIRLSELAYSKASMPETKEMANLILTDHGLAGAELTAIAQKNGITLPTTADAEAERKYDRLSKMEGADFDKEYADMMKNGHENAIKKFEEVSQEAGNSELRSFASSKLPALRTHLQHAEHCQEMAADAK